MPSQVTWTLGLSYDVIDDEYYNYEDTRLNPKFGIQWDIFDWLRVRAAAFNTTKKPLIVNQTIEPSQVAGFNQFFDDFNGAKSKRKAISVDVDLTSSLLAGFEYSLRNVDVPLARPSGPPIFLDQDENLHRGFLYWTPRKDLALTAEALWERIEPPLEFREVKSFSTPFTVRYFNPGGFFAQLGATFVRQSVDPAPTGTTTTRDQFTVIDAAVGYRLPNRRAIISLEIRNLLDEEFLYADYDYVNNTPTSSGARFLPSRSILGRISIGF
jgi:outer membrane receptor protein involved in Fe transport